VLEQVIFWGQIPAYVALAAVVGLFFKGVIVSRSQLDQVQKTADTFLAAWQTSNAVNEKQAELLGQLTVTNQTMLKVLSALPKPQTDERGDI
jgi:hypothetical protein